MGIQFPIFKTKISNSSKTFDLTDFKQRQAYFELKAGREIEKLREYLKSNTFIVYLLGKKNSGKGTYAKMFQEVVDKEKIEHFSIGDMIRGFDEVLADREKKKELISFLEKNYRGLMSLEEVIKFWENRNTKTLLPSELILALAKNEIAEKGRKALFVDGFPRGLDQVSYSLFFRDLIDYRQDPDIFVLIDVPEAVIDERIKYRVVCPICQTSRNLKLLPTKEAGYDEKEEKFFLMCDNSNCQGARMVAKEGDELGIGPIKERLEKDKELMEQAFLLYGIPKILLRNSVPIAEAGKFVDDYEITQAYSYQGDKETGKIKIKQSPWQILDDEGILSYSLMPPPVVVSLIKKMTEVLGL